MDTKGSELRRKIRETEADNEQLQERLSRANKHVMRLRLEKKILLDKFLQMNPEMATSLAQEEDNVSKDK